MQSVDRERVVSVFAREIECALEMSSRTLPRLRRLGVARMGRRCMCATGFERVMCLSLATGSREIAFKGRKKFLCSREVTPDSVGPCDLGAEDQCLIRGSASQCPMESSFADLGVCVVPERCKIDGHTESMQRASPR